jgi:hypothetical protein
MAETGVRIPVAVLAYAPCLRGVSRSKVADWKADWKSRVSGGAPERCRNARAHRRQCPPLTRGGIMCRCAGGSDATPPPRAGRAWTPEHLAALDADRVSPPSSRCAHSHA